jgi:hypothetical protein
MRFLWPLFFIASCAPANTLPVYSFFYPCSSGVVDCSSFQVHHEGSPGPATFPPELAPASGTTLTIFASNAAGEYVGGVIGYPSSGGPVPFEGLGSSTHCVAPGYFGVYCYDYMSLADINNNGIVIGNGPGSSYIGLFGQGLVPFDTLESAGLPLLTYPLLAINDSDQVLAFTAFTPTTGSPIFFEGVFSPTPVSPAAVPEPFSAALLFTVVGTLVCMRRARLAAAPIATLPRNEHCRDPRPRLERRKAQTTRLESPNTIGGHAAGVKATT